MAKTSGLGDNLYVGGYDLSGDIGSVDQISGGPALLDVTGISKSANERIGGLRDGDLQFTSFFNTAPAQEHAVLSALPTADVIGLYLRGTALGGPAAAINAKQVSYDPTRDNSGALTLKTELQASGYGLEWGKNLTAGWRTDSAATAGDEFDDGAASAHGGQLYVMLSAFTGTSVTVDLQSSATSGGTYATTGLTTTAMTAVGAQRVAVPDGTAIGEFLKVVTTGTFTSAKIAVVFVRNPVAVSF